MLAKAIVARKYLHGLLLFWLAASLLAFFVAPAAPLIPPDIAVPWSVVEDVALGASGRIYVYTAMWGKLLCYERDGRFCGAAPLLYGKGIMQLASTASGLLVAQKGYEICSAREPDFRNWLCWDRDPGNPTCSVFDSANSAPRKTSPSDTDAGLTVVVPDGTSLFCPSPRIPGIRFNNPVGEIERVGPSRRVTYSRITSRGEVRDVEGNVLTRFGPQWYLNWLGFPFPSLVPWIILLANEGIRTRIADRRWKARKRSLEKIPDADADEDGSR